MSAPLTTAPQVVAAPPPRRRRRLVVLVSVLVAFFVSAVLMLLAVQGFVRGVPEFPLLARNPDPSLQGSVAYYDRHGCIRLVAAAGAPSREVLCLPQGQDVKTAVELGKEIGPQLVWRSDGRLEVTMFRMLPRPGPGYRAGWQKLVDVRTGAVEDVPAAAVPSQPDSTTQPQVSPAGDRIRWSSDRQSGRIKVVLQQTTGTRTLLSAQGSRNYTYGLNAAFWAPTWTWIAADDGRILVITPGNPSRTRVLADDLGDMGFVGTGLSRFAVSSAPYVAAVR